MNRPHDDAERLLSLLREEKQPALSPYFEVRLRRAIAEDDQRPKQVCAIRIGAVVLLVISAVILWPYPWLRWLIPLAISQCMPEDWGDAIMRLLHLRGSTPLPRTPPDSTG